MSDDDEEDIIDALVGLRFYLSIERDPEDHDLLNIALAEIPRDIVPYVFSRPVSDIVTTTFDGNRDGDTVWRRRGGGTRRR